MIEQSIKTYLHRPINNPDDNILELYTVLVQLRFATSKTRLQKMRENSNLFNLTLNILALLTIRHL